MAGVLWHQEVFLKSSKQAKKLLPSLQRHQESIHGLNVPNKAKGELPQLLEQARLLSAALPHANICCHYAIAHNYGGSADAAFAALTGFCEQLATIERCSLLLVSGGHRKRLDSLQALQQAANSPSWQDLQVPLAVAFNPYFPDAEQQQEERQRLRLKLEAGRGRVEAVYLQAGSDVQRLRDSLQHLQQLLASKHLDVALQQPCAELAARPSKRQRPQLGETSAAAQPASSSTQAAAAPRPIQVFGSVLVPSRKLLANMKFRPWRGVFLSEEYLADVQQATAITKQILTVYAQHSVMPVVESLIETEAQCLEVEKLLKGGSA